MVESISNPVQFHKSSKSGSGHSSRSSKQNELLNETDEVLLGMKTSELMEELYGSVMATENYQAEIKERIEKFSKEDLHPNNCYEEFKLIK